MKTNFVLGLTGGIASGKSTVARLLAQLGATVVYSDIVAKQLMQDDNIVQQLVRAFGNTIVDDNNSIIVSTLRELVWSNIENIHKINNIMWPPTILAIQEILDKSKGLIVIESALLFESNLNQIVDLIATISIDDNIRRKRVLDRGDNSIAHLDIILACQLTDAKRESLANIVIYNNGDIDTLHNNTKILFDSLVASISNQLSTHTISDSII
ncbi:MAG: dephospho-CoA kinase [Clostridiales bacterium]|jgi:dephospho-CoA kinase|nr:dephospho-CoA kinase [Clostridiales bacterium]